MPNKKGFTFIEILVVLAIVVIMVTAIGISITAFNAKIKAGPFSYFLKQNFELIQQRAILEQSNFGICISKKSIILYRYNQIKSSWQEIKNSSDLKSIILPDTLKFNLEIDNRNQNLNNKCENPILIFNDGGFITPFRLEIKEKSNVFYLIANYGGGIDVTDKP